ncbi:hypothetical protein FBU30_006883 [Linnemannia zychae]|nr:hypothetical protein FBU30_006883 [Linnemannia zychae]
MSNSDTMVLSDSPRATRAGPTAGGGPFRFDTRDYQFSIIGVDDGPLDQQIMQALGGLGGAHGLDMGHDGGPTLIQIAGEPSTLRSLLGVNGGHFVQLGGAGTGPVEALDHARTLRSRMLAQRPVPLGAGLPHLATIEAELTRAATQLRNVQTILSHPADQLERIELEPLDVPELESVGDDIDGDSTDIERMRSILTQLSETSRTMANHLQSLSDQYINTLEISDRVNLQHASLRAARAMYRLASVQNTVFPMLANATFVDTAPGSVSYRFQPQSTASASTTGTTAAQTTAGERSLPQQASIVQGIPFPAFIRGSGMSPVTLGMIPSIMAHARASAQSVNAAMAAAAATGASRADQDASTASATSATSNSSITPSVTATQRATLASSVPVPRQGSGPIGQMVLGPNGSLSYTIQAPARVITRNSGRLPTYAAAAAAATNPFALNGGQGMPTRFMIPADFAGAGFLDFWRNMSGQTSNSAATAASDSTTIPGSTSTVPMNSSLSPGSTQASARSELSATTSTSRRRERPEDFLQAGADRAASRRRLESQVSQMNSSLLELENRLHQELDQMLERSEQGLGLALHLGGLGSSSGSAMPLTAGQGSRSNINTNSNTSATVGNTPLSRSQPPARPTTTRSSSNDARRTSGVTESSSPVSSPSPSSPSVSSSNQNSSGASSSNASSAYNLGRIGVFISAILRMVDQPREDGSPRTLADVICNDPESPSTPLQDLVRNVAASITVRETRSIVEGHPAPIRNIHSVLNTFIRECALNGQQLTESNLESVAVMFAHAIMNAVHVEDYLETLIPAASIQISSADIRRISLDVLSEHFRRLIYLVVSSPAGRESPTFARDVILWIRDVVGAWRVSFYGLFSERDQAEAQRIATHVVASAIHDNGRRWVELSNRATNTLVNVLCANIVPRRRGEEQAGGLVGGAWPLMATGSRQNSASRASVCRAPSLLGSPAYPVPLNRAANAGPSTLPNSSRSGSTSSSLSNSTALSQISSEEAESFSSNLTRRIGGMMSPLGVNTSALETLYGPSIREAIRAELANMRTTTDASSSSTLASTSVPSSGARSTTAAAKDEKPALPDHRTRVEDVEDEDMS